MLTWSYFVVRNAQSQRTWETKPDPTLWADSWPWGKRRLDGAAALRHRLDSPETFEPYPLFKIIAWCVFLGVIASWWGP